MCRSTNLGLLDNDVLSIIKFFFLFTEPNSNMECIETGFAIMFSGNNSRMDSMFLFIVDLTISYDESITT